MASDWLRCTLQAGKFHSINWKALSRAIAQRKLQWPMLRAYGLGDVARLLQRLGEGQGMELALRSTIHGGYADLEADIAIYLKKNYGE